MSSSSGWAMVSRDPPKCGALKKAQVTMPNRTQLGDLMAEGLERTTGSVDREGIAPACQAASASGNGCAWTTTSELTARVRHT